MKEKYLPNKKYYKFSTDCECGVVVDEKTMKKIQKILYKAEAEIKNILHNAEDVRPYMWSCVSIKQGDRIITQRVFHYTEFNQWCSVDHRIDNLKLTTPRYLDDFYEIKNKEELEDVEKCLIAELEDVEKCSIEELKKQKGD